MSYAEVLRMVMTVSTNELQVQIVSCEMFQLIICSC